MAQRVKDLALSLQWLRLLLWCGFDPWPWEFAHAENAGKKKKKKKNQISFYVRYIFSRNIKT